MHSIKNSCVFVFALFLQVSLCLYPCLAQRESLRPRFAFGESMERPANESVAFDTQKHTWMMYLWIGTCGGVLCTSELTPSVTPRIFIDSTLVAFFTIAGSLQCC